MKNFNRAETKSRNSRGLYKKPGQNKAEDLSIKHKKVDITKKVRSQEGLISQTKNPFQDEYEKTDSKKPD